MTNSNLEKLIRELLKLPSETEWLEFKHAKNKFDSDKLGKYFSALSNEANLKNEPYGWLIFGIEDKTRKIVGTQFRTRRADLDSLKHEIANDTTNKITFIEIYELSLPEGRVIMFQIPAAHDGVPTAWKGFHYGRNGEALGPLSLHEIDQIRNKFRQVDWSAQICEEARIDDLEPKAILKAREEYKRKNPHLAREIDEWEDIAFLNKARITIQSKITRTAIILLGKEESEHFISPSVAKISWILKDDQNIGLCSKVA